MRESSSTTLYLHLGLCHYRHWSIMPHPARKYPVFFALNPHALKILLYHSTTLGYSHNALVLLQTYLRTNPSISQNAARYALPYQKRLNCFLQLGNFGSSSQNYLLKLHYAHPKTSEIGRASC